MPGVGTTPPDYTAPIGQFRLLAQDTHYVDLNPTQPGQGTFDLFSDAEISGYLAMYEGYSPYRAVGAAYQGLAARAALQSKMVKDYDLQVDLTKQATALQATAEAMFERADKEDVLTGATSTFDLTAPPEDLGADIAFVAPYAWGLSPYEFARANGLAGLGIDIDIAQIGEGPNGDGVTITDGSSDS